MTTNTSMLFTLNHLIVEERGAFFFRGGNEQKLTFDALARERHREECYSDVQCRYWQYGKGGCWLERPSAMPPFSGPPETSRTGESKSQGIWGCFPIRLRGGEPMF